MKNCMFDSHREVPKSRLLQTTHTIVLNKCGRLAALCLALFCAARGRASDCVPAAAGIVAWWPAEGNANDSWGTNNGTLRGGAGFAPGEVGQAFSFDGSSGSVLVPDSPALRFTNAMTIEAWIYPTAVGGIPREIVSKYFGGDGHLSYTTSIDTSGQAYLVISSDGATTAAGVDYIVVYTADTVPVNQWSHFAATYDGAVAKVYLNGALENQAPWTKGICPGNSPLVIGEALYQSFFAGLIDEPTLYNRALSPAEIQQIYSAGSAGKCSSPIIKTQPLSQVGYWGGSVNFSVTATGSEPLAYQWQKDNVPINGATASTLVLTNLQAWNAGNYAVLVSDTGGSVLSSNANLTINPAGVSLALYPGLTINGEVGLTYGIQYNSNAANTNGWHGAANITLSAPTELWFDFQAPAYPARFYRVVPGPIPIP
ncbi:MAG TPA: LamG-like jellyroll fold domain-containing protein [Candidatus Acidoferrum sp.]|nr:LamG-like jellyroll fold domain-containing protein [Candidatus Acidoferrum sp.]